MEFSSHQKRERKGSGDRKKKAGWQEQTPVYAHKIWSHRTHENGAISTVCATTTTCSRVLSTTVILYFVWLWQKRHNV